MIWSFKSWDYNLHLFISKSSSSDYNLHLFIGSIGAQSPNPARQIIIHKISEKGDQIPGNHLPILNGTYSLRPRFIDWRDPILAANRKSELPNIRISNKSSSNEPRRHLRSFWARILDHVVILNVQISNKYQDPLQILYKSATNPVPMSLAGILDHFEHAS
jgi:hypothetical protein